MPGHGRIDFAGTPLRNVPLSLRDSSSVNPLMFAAGASLEDLPTNPVETLPENSPMNVAESFPDHRAVYPPGCTG